jgi:hypothetical protein
MAGQPKNRGSIPGKENRPGRFWRAPSLVFNGHWGFFLGVKRPGREVDHSLPFCVEVENDWSHTATLHHTPFRRVQGQLWLYRLLNWNLKRTQTNALLWLKFPCGDWTHSIHNKRTHTYREFLNTFATSNTYKHTHQHSNALFRSQNSEYIKGNATTTIIHMFGIYQNSEQNVKKWWLMFMHEYVYACCPSPTHSTRSKPSITCPQKNNCSALLYSDLKITQHDKLWSSSLCQFPSNTLNKTIFSLKARDKVSHSYKTVYNNNNNNNNTWNYKKKTGLHFLTLEIYELLETNRILFQDTKPRTHLLNKGSSLLRNRTRRHNFPQVPLSHNFTCLISTWHTLTEMWSVISRAKWNGMTHCNIGDFYSFCGAFAEEILPVVCSSVRW